MWLLNCKSWLKYTLILSQIANKYSEENNNDDLILWNNRKVTLKSRLRLLILLQKKYLCNCKSITKKTKFWWIHKQVIQTVLYWKWWQILLNICGDWQAFTLMHAFSSVFFFWIMSNGYKIHFVTLLFFIDCYKLTFTCYFVLFPIEFYLLKKLYMCFFVLLSNRQVSGCDRYHNF